MFFPYRDDNPLHHGPPVITISIIATCTLLYLFVQLPMDGRAEQAHVYGFGFIPVIFLGDANLPAGLSRIPAATTLITCMFLHGGLMHLVGNMWFLWLYGDNVEEALGRYRYLAFYLICGCAGTLTHAFIDPGSKVPLIGASGAISGVIAAYLMIWPRAKVDHILWNDKCACLCCPRLLAVRAVHCPAGSTADARWCCHSCSPWGVRLWPYSHSNIQEAWCETVSGETYDRLLAFPRQGI